MNAYLYIIFRFCNTRRRRLYNINVLINLWRFTKLGVWKLEHRRRGCFAVSKLVSIHVARTTNERENSPATIAFRVELDARDHRIFLVDRRFSCTFVDRHVIFRRFQRTRAARMQSDLTTMIFLFKYIFVFWSTRVSSDGEGLFSVLLSASSPRTRYNEYTTTRATRARFPTRRNINSFEYYYYY